MNAILNFLFKHKIFSSFLCLTVIGIVIYFARFYDSNKQDTISSLIGTIITILGFMLTVSQLKTVEEIASSTQIEVNKTISMVRARIKEIFSVSECAAAQQTVNDIEKYISDNKFELAVLKLKEIHKVLIGIYRDDDLKNISSINIDFLVKDIGLDITNLYRNISTPNQVDINEIFPHLRDASVVFIEIENFLKNHAL